MGIKGGIHLVKVRVPATSANLGPGFDTLGMALKMDNYVQITSLQNSEKKNFTDKIITEIRVKRKDKKIEVDPGSDLILKSLEKLAQYTGESLSNIKVTEELVSRPAQGLGSSAAAITGTILAANEFFQLNLSWQTLRLLACQVEGHPDNVIAAMEGGLTVSTFSSVDNFLFCEKIEPHEKFNAVIIIPEFTSNTKAQRSVVPECFDREDVIYNLSRTALLPIAFKEGREDKIGELMQDRLHQPYRCSNIPGWEEVIEAGYEAGALGIALSGAGPSIFALTKDKSRDVGKAMVDCWNKENVKAEYFVTSPDNRGSYIEEEL